MFMLISFMSKPGNRPHTTSIHILDNDSLLNIFYLYRPFLLGEDQPGPALSGGEEVGLGNGGGIDSPTFVKDGET